MPRRIGHPTSIPTFHERINEVSVPFAELSSAILRAPARKPGACAAAKPACCVEPIIYKVKKGRRKERKGKEVVNEWRGRSERKVGYSWTGLLADIITAIRTVRNLAVVAESLILLYDGR